MHHLKTVVLTSIAFILSLTSYTAFACTDLKITAKDGTVVIARSMEFALDLDSKITILPKGQERQSTAPDGTQGKKWTSKYGSVAIKVFDADIANDGMNEAGLATSALWLPGTQYQQVPEGQNSNAILINDLIFWILDNFKTVDEVKQALKNTFVWGKKMPQLGDKYPPLHIVVHDASGQSMVVEFIDGKQNIHDNKLGVTTNSPTFDWHMTNLRNYLTLTSKNVQPKSLAGQMLSGTGNSSGWIGLPGDWTPPSRFIRTTALVTAASKPANQRDAINLGNHILSSIDIPFGVVEDSTHKKPIYDYTQWTVIKDLTNRKFYFRTYHNMTLRLIDLTKLNFAPEAKAKTLKMEQGNDIVDVTDQLQ